MTPNMKELHGQQGVFSWCFSHSLLSVFSHYSKQTVEGFQTVASYGSILGPVYMERGCP